MSRLSEFTLHPDRVRKDERCLGMQDDALKPGERNMF